MIEKCFSGLIGILIIALLLSAVESAAKTFVFKPTIQSATYSDTANWVNRDYPGRQIVYGDTIDFEINASFNTAIIDSNILVEGFCQISEAVNWIVPVGVTATFQRSINDGWVAKKIASAIESSVQVAGLLALYACHASFDGFTNVTGTIRGDAEVTPIPEMGLSQSASFNDISVSGYCSGIAMKMYCDSLFVDNTGRVSISSGYDFNGGSLRADTVHNKGKIILHNETQMLCNYILNEGQINAGSLSGKLNNSGTIEIVQKPINSFTADLWDVVNSGSVRLFGSIYSPVLLNGVNNTGTFLVADFLNITSTSPWLIINGIIINSNQWSQAGTYAIAEMYGDFTNTGNVSVAGKTNFNDGNFTNNGLCGFYNPPFDFGIRIRNHFVNNANQSIIGPLEITGQLLNHGNITIRP